MTNPFLHALALAGLQSAHKDIGSAIANLSVARTNSSELGGEVDDAIAGLRDMQSEINGLLMKLGADPMGKEMAQAAE